MFDQSRVYKVKDEELDEVSGTVYLPEYVCRLLN